MALMLRLLEDLDRDVYNPYNDFGYALTPDLIHRHPRSHRHLRCREPSLGTLIEQSLPTWSQINRLAKDKSTGSLVGKDGFQVSMDVTEFKPNELNVKVVDNCIVVEGKHEEREDNHGHISRHFIRRYALPKDYDPDKVASTLSSDGVLTVSVPKPQAIEDKTNERVVQIQQTGPAHLNVKENNSEEPKGAAEK